MPEILYFRAILRSSPGVAYPHAQLFGRNLDRLRQECQAHLAKIPGEASYRIEQQCWEQVETVERPKEKAAEPAA